MSGTFREVVRGVSAAAMLGAVLTAAEDVPASECTGRVTPPEAVEIARQAAEKVGYGAKNLIADADELNTALLKYLARFPHDDPLPRWLRSTLTGRKFVAVHLKRPQDPPGSPPQTGGSAWIFVDACSGEVLAIWRGA